MLPGPYLLPLGGIIIVGNEIQDGGVVSELKDGAIPTQSGVYRAYRSGLSMQP